MYGIELTGPNKEYIKGIPRATEFPKQEPRPINALSSVFNFKTIKDIKKPIIKINIPDPKKENIKLKILILGNSIFQKNAIRANGNRILKLVKSNHLIK